MGDINKGGPRTPEGKAICSLNALRHGLTAAAVIIPGEREEDFQALLAELGAKATGDPVGDSLLEVAACALWRLRRVVRIEAELLTQEFRDDRWRPAAGCGEAFLRLEVNDHLGKLARYEAHLLRLLRGLLRGPDAAGPIRKAGA